MNPIVGIGELLWDLFPDGRKVAGGAPFNFAFHCHQLGHPAVIVSRVGDDDLGRELRDEVRRLGLSDEYIQTDPMHPTGTVRVKVDRRGQPTYTITEDVAWDYIEFGPRPAMLTEFAAAICFGTLAQRSPVSAHTIGRFITESRVRPKVFDANIRTDPDPYVMQRSLQRSRWLKLNELEFEQFLSIIPDDRPVEYRLIAALERWRGDDKLVIVTRGRDGCEVFYIGGPSPTYLFGISTETKRHLVVPGVPVRVVDTIGAGDAFTAAMVCLHLEGRPLRDCARFANHYAARVCEHRGATPRIDRAEVERAMFGTAGGPP
jgi:fructokinase